jgi:hypothetical protein
MIQALEFGSAVDEAAAASLTRWRWLVPETHAPFLITIFGDWFLEAADGTVHFLDTIRGELVAVAPSRAALDNISCQEIVAILKTREGFDRLLLEYGRVRASN